MERILGLDSHSNNNSVVEDIVAENFDIEQVAVWGLIGVVLSVVFQAMQPNE